MYYVCIEESKIISILNYKPTVPSSVLVIEISDNSYEKIVDQTHFFNIETSEIELLSSSILDEKAKAVKNAIHREALASTDWKVLRHLREKALNIQTSLTESEYLDLENQRNTAANSIL